MTLFASNSQRCALLQSLYLLKSNKNDFHPSTYIVDASVEIINSMSLSVG